MVRKSKKQQEEEAALAELILLWKILTQPAFTQAVVEEIRQLGEQSQRMMRALMGKENPPDEIS